VGVLATLVHISVAWPSVHLLHVPAVLANFMGFCVAVAFSMAGHAMYTFRQALTRAKAMRFSVVSLSSLGFSSLLVLALGHVTRLQPESIVILAALLTPAFTYLCHSLWTFRHPGEKIG
jgi:putative flippase GtrA